MITLPFKRTNWFKEADLIWNDLMLRFTITLIELIADVVDYYLLFLEG